MADAYALLKWGTESEKESRQETSPCRTFRLRRPRRHICRQGRQVRCGHLYADVVGVEAKQQDQTFEWVRSWITNIGRTLSFRSGVYRGMSIDSRAAWQAAVTWMGVGIASELWGGLWELEGSLLSIVGRTVLGWTIHLLLYSSLVSAMAESSGERPYRLADGVTSIGFSLLPLLILGVTQDVSPLSFPLFLVSFLWMPAMQVQGMRELGVGRTRAVAIASIWTFLMLSLVLLMNM